ncbi:nuclear exosome regulator NRDE2 [Drosophila takahashii]|uniref:nuclear exosome regulator NRDE2 n=1 Tax=Drosophila takahashii TaxID=29030 RepID=UPI001CF8B264|nr:uncharacterized protein LOC108055519 [Drosophila takahashii]
MSLFPAYGNSPAAVSAKETPEKPAKETATTGEDWRNNRSYDKKDIDDGDIATRGAKSDSSTSSDSSEEEEEEKDKDQEQKKPGAKKKDQPQGKPLEFDAKDEFYVDKKGNMSFRSLSKLTKPTRPRYKSRMRRLRDPEVKPTERAGRSKLSSSKSSRYTARKPLPTEAPTAEEKSQLQEQLMQTRVLVQREPKVLDHWLQLHRLLDLNLDRANRLAVAEQELHHLETALEHHPSNEQILRLYTDVANATYPASEVAARFEKMLEKNPFEYTLWTSLIMVTQGNMARCSVPAVLRIYAFSMRRMQVGHTDEQSRKFATVDTDRIMLKLFHNCVLFLRQSGNMNKMFALLRLEMELNFPGLTVDCFEACTANEESLIEYEEMVLRSGMPMPEIWTRVERLRQAYCYLPYPPLAASAQDEVERGLDSQRCIYSDDVVPYAHALKSPNNRLHLLLLVVQLTKMPLVRSSCLAEKLNPCIDEFGESEAIEMLFAGLADRPTYAVPPSVQQAEFEAALINLAKELSVTPSFMPHFMGHELYGRTISDLLLKCIEAFAAEGEELKRHVFLLLWLRFQRLLVVLHKLMGKLTKEYLSETRRRIRNQMIKPENRCVPRFFTELAMCVFEGQEVDDNRNRAFDIFEKIIQQDFDSDKPSRDEMYAYLVCSEMLIRRGRWSEAIHLLRCTSMGRHAASMPQTPCLELSLRTGLELLAVEVQQLDSLPAEMPLEEYFLPNRLIMLLRVRCLLWRLDARNAQPDSLFDKLLTYPLGPKEAKASEWRRFLREQVMEVQIMQMQLPIPREEDRGAEEGNVKDKGGKSKRLDELVELGLEEFPRNLLMLQTFSGFKTMLWHKQRARFIRTEAGIVSLLHWVLAANTRFANTGGHDELLASMAGCLHMAVRNRLINMFQTFLPTKAGRSEIEEEQYRILRRNSIYWRLYLKCLTDTRTSFERTKEALLMAIDECPWDKALLMDGATALPKEQSFLQDLMTEKEMRVYALAEELDMLRSGH